LRVKLIKIAAIGLGTLVALVVLVLLFGVPAKPLLGYVQDQADKAGYRLRVEGAAKLSLWPSLNIAADDVRVGDNDNPELLTAKQIRIEVPLLSLVTGDPRISELALKEPVIKAASGRAGRGNTQSDKPKAMAIDRLTIENGTLITRDVRENLEFRIDAMQVTASLPAQGALDFQMQGKSGDQTVRLTLKANSASQIAEGRSTPIDVRLDLPGALKGSLAFTANLRSTNQVTSIDGIRGTLGSGRINGSVSVDTSGARPSTTANLVFDRLEMGNADRSNAAAGTEPWSDKPLELRALRIFDAVIKISARELSVGKTVLSPADIEMNVSGGLMSIALSRAELYGGPVQGRFVVDAAAREPRHGMNFEFSKVNALPFLTDVAGFDYFEGNLQGRFDLTATGNSERAIMASLGGTVQLTLQDGAIRGLNIPSIVRALSSQTLQGWQDRQTEKTDLTSMNASYRVANGVATVEDMRLSGPLVRMTGKGTVDIAAQTIDLRVDPKVVLSLQGQGASNEPAGLGVPVVIRGPWNNPQLHPEIAGILDNPDAAFAKLKTMGGSLFGVLRDEASTPAGRKRLEDAGKSLEQMMRDSGGFKPPTAEQRNRARDVIRDFFGR
jgi:AsmA protein